jgi:hypothetical protein
MNKQAQPQQARRECNVDRTHTVGQWLNANPDAKRMFNAGILKRDQREFLHLVPGAGGRRAELGAGVGFDISCKARAV